MKSSLTPEQSQRLIELGVDPSKASEHSIYMKMEAGCRGIIQEPAYNPIFTLSDILSLLPKEIEVYYDGETIPYHIVITTNGSNDWEVSYYDNEALKTAPELINALFELLVWSINNKYVKI